MQTHVVAGILVGGLSTRMGRCKPIMPHPIHGHTLVEHVCHCAQAACSEVVLLGLLDPIPDALSSLRRLDDEVSDAGPLSGLAALLRHVGDGWGLLLASDLAWLEPSVLRQLCDAISPEADAIAAKPADDAPWWACTALYHTRLLPRVLSRLRSNDRSLQALLREAATVSMKLPIEAAERLRSANTPADFA